MKVKIFTHYNEVVIEKSVNNWIKKNKNYEVVDIKFSESQCLITEREEINMSYSAMIIYK